MGKQDYIISAPLKVFKYSIETLHKYYNHIEDVHMTFCTQKYNFFQNYCNFDNFDISDISLKYRLNVLEGHGWRLGKG